MGNNHRSALHQDNRTVSVFHYVVLLILGMGGFYGHCGSALVKGAVLESEHSDDSKFVPKEFQLEQSWQTGTNCGATACYVLLRLLEVDCRWEDVATCVPVTDAGASLLDLKKMLESHGVKADVLRGSPNDLQHVALPCIVHQAYDHLPQRGHYFVLCTREPGKFGAIDGTSGAFFKLDAAVFERSWSGYLLVPRPFSPERGLRIALYLIVANCVVCFLVRTVITWCKKFRSSAIESAVPKP